MESRRKLELQITKSVLVGAHHNRHLGIEEELIETN